MSVSAKRLVDVRRELLLGDEGDQVAEFRAVAERRAEHGELPDEQARKSADGSPPVVAPQVTSRPPRTSAFIAVGHTALPTFSITTSTPRLPVSAMTRSRTDEPPSSRIVSAAPNAAHARELRRIARSDDRARSDRRGDLGRRQRHRAADAENQRRLSGSKPRLGDDHTPRREPGDAERCGLNEIERLGLSDDAALRRGDDIRRKSRRPARRRFSRRCTRPPRPFGRIRRFRRAGRDRSTTASSARKVEPASASTTTPAPSSPRMIGSRWVMPTPRCAYKDRPG